MIKFVLRLTTVIPQRTSQFSSMSRIGMLQLAPSIDHQISAMFSILERSAEQSFSYCCLTDLYSPLRYNWYRFGIVTSHMAGHENFLQKVREKCVLEKNRFAKGRFAVEEYLYC